MISAKGIAAYSATEKLKPYNFERRDPKDHDVLIDIMFCGVCHGDIHASRNDWGSANYPLVPGHEIAGIVRAIGSKVTKYKVGDHVGVGCFVDSCRECSLCHEGRENYCEKGVTLTYDSFERDGTTLTQGGYSNIIVVDENYVLRIPKSIPLDKAAPLLCAGITLYSPLVHWKAGPGKKVGIVGMGGLGHMGVKIARALGAEVTVFSRTDAKKEDALQMGANLYLATQDNKVFQKYAGYFDLIINTVSSSDLDMSAYLGLLKVDATFVSVGAPDKPLSIDPISLIMKRTNFSGSANGSIRETQEMFDFCEKHDITPEIELIKPDEINEAFERVLKSDVRYRFVIDMKALN